MNPSSIFAPFALPYALVLTAKNHAYAQGWLRQKRLKQPVVSIGNLSVGGAGKTPFVIAIAQLLAEQGFHPDILSRGYRRQSGRAVERVNPAGDATRYGDEPLLIANATGLPVYVDASRYAAGMLCERITPPSATNIHLLDDGFQHRALARSVDIVLLHPSDIAGRLLPAGRLREPQSSLHRADFLVLREDDAATEPALHRAGIHKPVWRMRRSLVTPPSVKKAFAFCGIAHPAEFFAALRAQGILLERTVAFRDHHGFTPADLRTIAEQAHGHGCDILLTTEKDFIRLTPGQKMQLARTAPIHAVPLRVEILDVSRCLAALRSLLSDRHPEASLLS
jgi:tetraacyldisaccharide 4'-kinase